MANSTDSEVVADLSRPDRSTLSMPMREDHAGSLSTRAARATEHAGWLVGEPLSRRAESGVRSACIPRSGGRGGPSTWQKGVSRPHCEKGGRGDSHRAPTPITSEVGGGASRTWKTAYTSPPQAATPCRHRQSRGHRYRQSQIRSRQCRRWPRRPRNAQHRRGANGRSADTHRTATAPPP